MTPTPATISDSKDKKPASPTSSASTDTSLANPSSTAPISTTPPTAKDAVPNTKETSSLVKSSQEASPEVIQHYVKPKVVEKVFDLPVVSDTYDSLVKLSSPLSPYVEKIGTMASPVVDQALDIRARIEENVPESIQNG